MSRVERGRLSLAAGTTAIVVFVLAVMLAMMAPTLVALAMPARVRIPRTAAARAFAPVAHGQFSHPAHEPLHCFQCHPGIFPQADLGFTHADMERGRFCGSCHDGQRAPAITKFACEACHAP